MQEAAAGTISAPAAPSPAEPARGGGVLHVALIGNPNTGKSTLFNALTGMRQRVGNYSGVTVERVEGRYRDGDAAVTVIDLPGTYSLSASSPDEEIALAVLTGWGAVKCLQATKAWLHNAEGGSGVTSMAPKPCKRSRTAGASTACSVA